MSQRLPAPKIRAAVVASTLASAAALAVLPTMSVSAAPAPAQPAPAPVTRDVAPIAQTAPAVAPRVAAASKAAASRSSAVQNALGKVGAPYRWGASGPSSFDCSGLVNWAYKQEGVSLPRTSRALASAGSPVSKSALRPGDLVTFYKSASHVGIYVGNGKVVHASTSGTPVKMSSMNSMPFNSARRI